MCLLYDLRGDLVAFFTLGDAVLGVVAGEVADVDDPGFDEFGVVALELMGGFFEGLVDGASGAGGLLGCAHGLSPWGF